MTGLLGMATKYAEALLGVRYREVDARGNMVQSNSVADALHSSFGIRPLWTGLVIAVLAAAVILGGIRSIGRVTSFFVPMMIALYMLGGLVVLAINWRGLPDIIRFVFADAFSPSAAVGGFMGATVREGIRWGVARGVFSNESGLGTGGIAAAAGQSHIPASQALVSMTQTFTGFVIYLFGVRAITPYRLAFVVAAFAGSVALECGEAERAGFAAVWGFSDIMNGMMAIPNLVGLLLLSRVIVEETRRYKESRALP